MNKNNYLLTLKLFGFSFYNEVFQICDGYQKKDMQGCKLCNLYKSKQKFYESKLIKSNIFILSSYNLDFKDLDYFNFILRTSINLTLENIYFSSIVKCSNDYNYESVKKCIQFSLNEFIQSGAKILILMGESLKKIFNLERHFTGEKVFLTLRGRLIVVLLNYDINFIKKNPSYETDFINNLKKIKEEM